METPTFLYKPNFCAECGEKIDRENWHFWSSRRFCENCEPVYRMNRIFPPALAAIVLFFGGIFFGQMGRRNEKPNPVISTQAALVMEKSAEKSGEKTGEKPGEKSSEKPAPAAAKQALAANTGAAQNTSPVNSGIEAGPKQPAAVYTAIYTCGARTQKGTPCSRRVKNAGTRCWQHPGRPAMAND